MPSNPYHRSGLIAGTERLRRVAHAVEGVLADRELLRQTVNDIIRDFIEHERRHMAREERDFPGRRRGSTTSGLGGDRLEID